MYSLEIDQELAVGDKVYYIQVSAKLDYSYEEDPECTGVEVTRAEIAPLEGDPLPIGYEGIAIEKIIVEGHPELTEAIDRVEAAARAAAKAIVTSAPSKGKTL